MIMTKALIENMGLTEDQAKSFRRIANYTSLIDIFGDDISDKANEYMGEAILSDDILSSLVVGLDGDESSIMEHLESNQELNDRYMKIYNEVLDRVIKEFSGYTEKIKFKLSGSNNTNKCRRPHLPRYLDIQEGSYTAGRSGTIELIDMIVDVKVVVTRKVKATKKCKGLVEGYYSVNIEEVKSAE